MATFKAALGRFTRKANGRADTALRALALECLSRVVQRTPVDTGRARGGWTVGIGAPKAGGDRLDPVGNETINAGAATIENARATDSVYITSNVPYIRRLEYEGHSPQAPNGMVRITVMELQTMLAAAAAKAKARNP